MDTYLIETSALSCYFDRGHAKHSDARRLIGSLDPASPKFVSTIAIAELTFGLRLVEIFEARSLPTVKQIIQEAHSYAVLDVSRHTAAAYGELKANLAQKYLANVNRRERPRWLEEWVDKNTGQRLQVDENDLWMCAQAKERDLVLITADARINRIAHADPQVRLLVI